MSGAVGLEGPRIILSLVIIQRHIHKWAVSTRYWQSSYGQSTKWIPSLPVDRGLTAVVVIYIYMISFEYTERRSAR